MRKLLLFGLVLLVLAPNALGGDTRTQVPTIHRDRDFLMQGKFIAWQFLNPAAADTDAVHSQYETSADQDTSYAFTSAEGVGTAAHNIQGTSLTLTLPRNLTVTNSGTAANIDVGNTTIYGTNILGEAINEVFAFTENTAETITGSKAFATVDSFVVHQQDGANVHVSVGVGDKLGLPLTLPANTIQDAWVGATFETTAPTVAVSATAIESNTIDFNANPDGTRDFIIRIWVPPFGSVTAVSLW